MNWSELVSLADDEVRLVIRSLPDRLKEAVASVPVIMERVPSRALVKSGIAPDTMGLFEGDSIAAPADGSPWPVRIILFLENIRDEAGDCPEVFRAEVRQTLLHEIGHYLGLEEDGLIARDLE